MLWLHALSTRKNWVAQFNWMDRKTYQNDCYCKVNARFSQGLLQLLFTFFGSKTCKNEQ